MKTSRIKVPILFLIGILIISACNFPSATNGGSNLAAPPAVSPAVSVASTTIQHKTIPGNLPSDRMSQIGDYDSSTIPKAAPGGDRFSFGQYERPFNANTMDKYFPYLDIQGAVVLQDQTWIFSVIGVKGRDSNKALPGIYAVQLDTNRDGRGDWLITASNPATTDWTTDGVQVWQDMNGDVGGKIPVLADDHPVPGDGFETNVFDSGKGNDPDAAWVRIAPDNPTSIQIALKRSLINSDKYLASMWAGASLDPALFDFNDHMTQEQAGAADPGLKNYYPIKSLVELDNTCSMAIGFVPKGNEPGLCREFVPVVPEPYVPGVPPPPPPCIPSITHVGGCR